MLSDEVLLTLEEMASLKAEQQAIAHRRELERDREQEEKDRQRKDSTGFISTGI